MQERPRRNSTRDEKWITSLFKNTLDRAKRNLIRDTRWINNLINLSRSDPLLQFYRNLLPSYCLTVTTVVYNLQGRNDYPERFALFPGMPHFTAFLVCPGRGILHYHYQPDTWRSDFESGKT